MWWWGKGQASPRDSTSRQAGAVALYTFRSSGYFCAGSLVNSSVVLTAAHCLVDDHGTYLESVWASVHRHDITMTAAAEMNELENERGGADGCAANIFVSSIKVHPDYSSVTEGADVALLYLSSPAPCAGQETPIIAIDTGIDDWAGSQLTVAGWGRTSSSPRASPPTSDVLREADVIGVANVGCEAAYGRADMTGMLCASDGSARGDACQGDSGGPLWSAAGAEPVLFPNDYANFKDCTITGLPQAALDVIAFDVEGDEDSYFDYDGDGDPTNDCTYDYLLVNGVKYCGTSGPAGVVPSDGNMAWAKAPASSFALKISATRRQRALAAIDQVEAAVISSFAATDPPVTVTAEQMTLEDLGDSKVRVTIVQAEGGPTVEDLTAAAEQPAFLTRMAVELEVAEVSFDLPPATIARALRKRVKRHPMREVPLRFVNLFLVLFRKSEMKVEAMKAAQD
ncbi:hypothetical protein EMIHUDRAFT_241277 [Emiliania huxleyi CCMP1516]|uniref:Peptidase S1 domain-containing protein n=2 Tax=Emiliania huxleyi TaxID=2903 RepID=A0A0D3JCZ1_EMIH1|nr:hypothetical protein EMIHUDRAFT_241277 [Emiliania huxleyi CCMP1516]EOD21376.1 hypothetical protein EMIHUDRAFT_241277 [Emiliania huxleyi CCMP1516]|eukprot:XP_005773805.1 hypothetical protein EMIHUDRAFT_241277 [Emiliania huxleyi CCMP1516]